MKILIIFSSAVLAYLNISCDAWISSPLATKALNRQSFLPLNESVEPISTALPRDENVWKSEGERIIKSAAMECGTKEEDIDIQWKSGRIEIKISGDTYIQAKEDDEDEDDVGIVYDGDIDEEAIKEFNEEFGEPGEGDAEEEEDARPTFGSDIVSIGRAINYALGEGGEGSVGYNIAVHHEIEVSTPGASDELQGIMFESYKGFDVIVSLMDPKKKKAKNVEGKLIQRTDKLTIVNVKGRQRKMKNELVLSVKLPKAKREKGVR